MKLLKYFFVALAMAWTTETLSAQEYQFYRADTLSSKINWKCDKHNGIFKLNTGGFVLNDSLQPVAGIFIINVKSLKDLDMDPKQFGTAVMILENTLKNEFFEVEKFPNAVFDLQEAKKIKDDYYLLTGDFTLHGITNCISFKAKLTIDDAKIHLISDTFSIDRTDWGIYRLSPKRPYSDDENGWTVPDMVDLTIDIIARKE